MEWSARALFCGFASCLLCVPLSCGGDDGGRADNTSDGGASGDGGVSCGNDSECPLESPFCSSGTCVVCRVDSDCDDLLELCQEGQCVGQSCSLTTEQIQAQCGESGRYCLTLTNFDCTEMSCIFGPRDCDDGDRCTADTCNESLAQCEHSLSPPVSSETGSTCDNAIDDDCDGRVDIEEVSCGGCFEDADCDDGNDCTADACSANACSQTPVASGGSCSDGDACTTNDRCESGACIGDPFDGDGDGYGSLDCGGEDCDDTTVTRSPGVSEEPGPLCSDGIDNDCDDVVDDWDPTCSPICLRGFCWTMPVLAGWTIFDGAGDASGVWLVGEEGATLRWDRNAWTAFDAGTTEALRGVWLSPTGPWAAGDAGTVVSWTGSAWTLVAPPASTNLFAISGTADTNVWVGGDGGAVHQWTGSGWQDRSIGLDERVQSLLVVSATDVWAGTSSALHHYNSGTWTQSMGGSTTDLWRAAPSDLWGIVSGALVRNTGGSWTPVAGAPAGAVRGWANAPNDVWVVDDDGQANHFDGAWTAPANVGEQMIVAASAADEVWFAGRDGRLIAWDGSAQHLVGESPAPRLVDERRVFELFALSDDLAWASGEYGAIFEWNGARWRALPENLNAQNSLDVEDGNLDLWASSRTDLYVVGGNQYPARGSEQGFFERWNGTAWSLLDDNGGLVYKGIWATASNDIWIAASGRSTSAVLHWNGAAMAEVPVGTAPFGLHDVSGTSSSDLWFAGSEQVLHYDGQDWSIEPLPCGPLSLVSIQAVAPGDVWIAARAYAPSSCPTEGGLVLHRESGVFTIVRAAPDVSFVNDLWAAGPSDVWVTDQENVHHFDGTWSVIPRAGKSISGLGGMRGGTPWGLGSPRRILRKAP